MTSSWYLSMKSIKLNQMIKKRMIFSIVYDLPWIMVFLWRIRGFANNFQEWRSQSREKIDWQITLRGTKTRCPRHINLKEINENSHRLIAVPLLFTIDNQLWYCDVTQTRIVKSFWQIVLRMFPSWSREFSRRQVDYHSLVLSARFAAFSLVSMYEI